MGRAAHVTSQSLFDLFDFIGRTLPRWFTLFNEKTIWIPILLRMVFFPLFALCVKPLVFGHIAWSITFMSIFALTNGFLGSAFRGRTIVDQRLTRCFPQVLQ